MSSINVQPGQTLEDIAIQYCGDYSAIFQLAKLNGLSLTDDLVPGQALVLPAAVNARVRSVYADRRYVPASGVEVVEEGIGYWGIEYDFVVGGSTLEGIDTWQIEYEFTVQ